MTFLTIEYLELQLKNIKNNHKINIYTIDDPEHANKLIELNVDYITSNLLS